MSDLRRRLEGVPVPGGEEASRRAWTLTAEAYGVLPPRRRRAGRARLAGALALAAVLLLAAVAVAAQRPRWVRHVLGTVHTAPPRARLGPLPAGRLLVSSRSGTWIVHADGTRTRLGAYTAATWSPRGLYVAAWRGRELSAVAPDGHVAWTIAARGAVSDAQWSPDGYRIAYRRGASLDVVAGDGTAPRTLASAVAAVTPAWRPGAPHSLAWVDASGRVVVADVDTRRVAWRSAATVGAVRELAWSADGRFLVARGARRVVVLDVRRDRARPVSLRNGTRVTAATWAPHGHRLALVTRTGTTSRVDVLTAARLPRRPVFATVGTLGSATWSPRGSRLLVRWSEADQWLLLGPGRTPAPITAIAGVGRRFGGTPTVRGWCCSG